MRIVAVVCLVAFAACSDSSLPDPDEVGYFAFGSSASTVSVFWLPVDGATAYTIERGASDAELAPIATLVSPTTSFLDTGLAPLTTYSYRVSITTADGVTTAKPIQHPTTTDDELLVTGDPVPVGLAVTQTVGAGGASIEITDAAATLVVPPGAVPDGTTITLQAIASPYDDDPDSRGVAITTSAVITQPVELVYALDELDVLGPDYVAIAVHQDDGSWVAQPRVVDVDAGTVTLAITPDSTGARARPAVPVKWHDTVKLRSTIITPRRATVKVRESLHLVPVGLFSDDPCQVPSDLEAGLCTAVVIASIVGRKVLPSDIRRPAFFAKELANIAPHYERDWTVNDVIGGSAVVGTAVASGAVGATYTAPAAKPAGDLVFVRFTSVQTEPERRAVPAVPAFITIHDPGSVRVTAVYASGPSSPDLCGINGLSELTDRFTFALTLSSQLEVAVEAIQNQPTTIGPLTPPPDYTVTVDADPEVFTLTSGTAYDLMTGKILVELMGTSTGGACTLSDGQNSTPAFGPPITTQFSFYIDSQLQITFDDPPQGWTLTAEEVVSP